MAVATMARNERQWYIVGRWQEFEGEGRANLLRVAAVAAFYAVQLVHFHYYSGKDAAEIAFHQKATAVAAAWTLVAIAILVCLRSHVFPAAVKYVSSACDLVLLTALASLAAGPASPLVTAYFVIIALAAIRFSLPLVWFCTLGSMIGYLALVGRADPVWFDSRHSVPIATQLTTLVSLALTGIVTGQVVRRVKAMAADYAARLGASGRRA